MTRLTMTTCTASLVGVLLAGLIAGCYDEPVAIATDPPIGSSSPSESPSPTGPGDTPTAPGQTPTPSTATPIPVASGAPTADCVNGWISPAFESQEYGTAIYLIERHMGVSGSWTVDEMRYFLGPDVSWRETPAPQVRRWYVKAELDGADFRARWLMEQRSDLDFGVVAVAPYDSTGYASPDWTGFTGEGEPRTYLGLPGTWSGTPYDFVSGSGYSGQPGLPDEVAGCLTGT